MRPCGVWSKGVGPEFIYLRRIGVSLNNWRVNDVSGYINREHVDGWIIFRKIWEGKDIGQELFEGLWRIDVEFGSDLESRGHEEAANMKSFLAVAKLPAGWGNKWIFWENLDTEWKIGMIRGGVNKSVSALHFYLLTTPQLTRDTGMCSPQLYVFFYTVKIHRSNPKFVRSIIKCRIKFSELVSLENRER